MSSIVARWHAIVEPRCGGAGIGLEASCSGQSSFSRAVNGTDERSEIEGMRKEEEAEVSERDMTEPT